MSRTLALLGLAAGLGLGLLYAWVISPVEYIDTDPSTLRSHDRIEWMKWAAGAYAVDGDAGRARARLQALGEADPARAAAALAQRLAAAGASADEVRSLADLAAGLGAGPEPRASATASPTASAASTASGRATAAATATRTAQPTAAATKTPVPRPTATRLPSATPVLLPTVPPSPTPPGVLVFVGQTFACDSRLRPPLLQVQAQDAQGRGLAGVEVLIEWSGGQDRFFTGLKPELGRGYGDFAMQPNVLYTVRLASDPSGEIPVRSDPCTDSSGTLIATSVLLTFLKP